MKRFSSIFSQLLQLFPRLEFETAVRDHRAERHARGFASWSQFIAMLFCQLGRAHSLREICGGLASVEGKLRHLGLQEAPKRSTLAYANRHRPWQLYQTVFGQLLEKCQGVVAQRGGKTFRFKNKLMSLDASVIDLSLSLFDWARFRRTKGAIKLHLLLDHDGYLPAFAVITEGKTSDITVARRMRFEPGTVLAIDRGYIDYDWLVDLTRQGVYFVTRLKRNAVLDVVEDRPVPANRRVLKDQIVFFPRHAEPSGRVLLPTRRGVEPGEAGVDRLLDQPPGVRRDDDCRHLQGPVAGRAVLQSAEAKPEDQDVPWDQRQCGENPDLDRSDRDAATQVPAATLHLWLVAL